MMIEELSLLMLNNFNVGGDFSYDDSANNLDWGVNDKLTVLGSSDIVANNFAKEFLMWVT